MIKSWLGILISSGISWCSCNAFAPFSFPLDSAQKTQALRFHGFTSSQSSLSSLSLSNKEECDVLVLGSGPAARAIAYLLSAPQNKLDVLLADSNYDKKWPPNYGVWEDEWQAICKAYQQEFNRNNIAHDKCIDRRWSVTDCYFGGSFDIPTTQRFRIDRPYLRIDKDFLQQALSPTHTTTTTTTNNNNEVDSPPQDQGWYRVLKANHMSQAINVNLYSPPLSLVHDGNGSTIQLSLKSNDEKDISTTTITTTSTSTASSSSDNLITVRAKLIVDCTGHETKLVLKDTRTKSIPPGFQIAYGCLVKVNTTIPSYTDTQIGPYDKEAMTLFDYRTDHFENDANQLQKAEMAPTFMYAMPLKDNRIFFEETSLVARPAISFQECKDRTATRLKHLGIEVLDIEEEEFCYIPMGGPLPEKNQRVIAFGGASAMVHPSTGYNLCRNLMGAIDVTKAIVNGLSSTKNPNLDLIAGNAYHAMWSPSNVRQRNFAVFGGEFLMKQNVEGLRGFFDGFFRLPMEMWGGFLAGWPGLPNNDKHDNWFARLWFGLTFVSKLPPKVALDMLTSIVTYSITEGVALPQSVTPLFGQPESFEYVERPKYQGDVAAKNEARRMIQESMVEVEVPVSFESTEKEKV